jgi:hypothetical protein
LTPDETEAERRAWKPTATRRSGQKRTAVPAVTAGTARKISNEASPNGESAAATTRVESNLAQTIVEASDTNAESAGPRISAVGDLGDQDYWIVSSRGCDPSKLPADALRCLSFHHKVGDRVLVREPGNAFMSAIRPDRPICFVVHGSYNRWSDVVAESQKIHRWLKNAAPESPLQVVIFSWPADGNMPYLLPVDITILGNRGAAHSVFLAKLITQLPSEQLVSIVGHSHGARVTLAALHLLGGGRLEDGVVLPKGSPHPSHLRTVLIAAAVDHNWMNPGQRYDRSLYVTERLLLMRNSRDGWLTVYPTRTVIGERALGKGGLGRADRAKLGSLGSKVVELDAAQFTNWRHSFQDFHGCAELGRAMFPYVYFQEESASAGKPSFGLRDGRSTVSLDDAAALANLPAFPDE